MTIVTNDVVWKHGAAGVISLGTTGASLADDNFTPAADFSNIVVADVTGVLAFAFVLTYTPGSAPAAGAGIELHLRRLNIDGTEDEPQPALTPEYTGALAGTFSTVAGTGIQRVPLVISNVDKPTWTPTESQTLEPYLRNKLGGSIAINAGAELKYQIVTPGYKA